MSTSFRLADFYATHVLIFFSFFLSYSALKKADPEHAFLVDLEEKNQLFDTAAAKFSAKVSA